jgi:hypothetical protein
MTFAVGLVCAIPEAQRNTHAKEKRKNFSLAQHTSKV